ncbi:MAG: AraC family transcriptional regulator [Chitinophagaceae bacterium]
MKADVLHEITPLTQSDCFTLFYRVKAGFDFPLHYHEEFELNFIFNAKGVKRVVGSHIDSINDLELVLLGPNLQHGWFNHKCKSKKITEITIQFHRDLFDEKLLQRNQMRNIRSMFEQSFRGILFSEETIKALKPRIMNLPEKHGFDSVLELVSILSELSISPGQRTLSEMAVKGAETINYNSRRIATIMHYLNTNFENEISLGRAAKLVSMSEVAFSRFFKARTGKNFIDALNEIRLGNASRMLIDTTHSINEIAFKCGFNNISNFNRVFKKRKKCTPKEFRLEFNAVGFRTFI